MITNSLEDKLAVMIHYQQELRAGRTHKDEAAFQSYLDDPEVAQWLDAANKKGQIRNTRFLMKNPR